MVVPTYGGADLWWCRLMVVPTYGGADLLYLHRTCIGKINRNYPVTREVTGQGALLVISVGARRYIFWMVRRTRLDLVEIVCIVWLNQHTLEEMHRVQIDLVINTTSTFGELFVWKTPFSGSYRNFLYSQLPNQYWEKGGNILHKDSTALCRRSF